MPNENTEPIPVPPPAVAAPTDAPAPSAPAPAEPTPAPVEAAPEAPTPKPEPEATPAAPPASTAAEPGPAETAPAPEPAATPAPEPVAAASSVKEEEKDKADEPKPEPVVEGTKAAVEEPAVPTATTSAPEPQPEAAAESKPDEAAAPVSTTEAKPEKAAKEEEVEEPQNTLTKKFTDAEWKAVKELRAQLPEIFTKAYPDQSPAPTSITLWGVTLSTTPDAKASVILCKFVRARELRVKDAAEMLVATLKWRDEFKIDEIMKEEFDPEVFGKLGKVFGKDKDGRPVTYNLYGAVKDMKAVFGDVQKFIRWRVQFMEQSIELLDFETIDQMVQIHDYEGVSMTSRDASQKAAAKEATNIFQNHYPEFLSRKYFINVPTLLTWVFWLFKPLISAATLAKMSVVGSGARTIGAELSQVIPVEELPKKYGGQADAEDF